MPIQQASQVVAPGRVTSSANRIVPLGICAVVFLLYLPTLRFEFVYDDHLQIVGNPLLRDWHNWPWLFRTDVWSFWNPLRVGNYWRPLFMVWLLLNRILFGFNPIGWHATTVALHIACTYFIYRLFLKLTPDFVLAAIGALIFALHPTHLETAAWISGTTDSLAGCFMLPSLLCFINGWENSSGRKWLSWIGSALLYGGALLVKETAAITPVFALAYVLLLSRGEHWLRRALFAMVPFGVVAMTYLAARAHVLHGLGHYLSPIPIKDALLSVPWLVWFYIRHLAWPMGLGVFYDVPLVSAVMSKAFLLPTLALLLLGTAFTVLVYRTRDMLLLFAALWVILPLVPVLYIPFLGTDNFVNDRYLYFPSVGFALIVAWLLRRVQLGSISLFRMPSLQLVLTVTLVLGLATATSAQQIYWANDLLLHRHGIETAPGSTLAFINFGTALAQRGRTQEARFAYEQVLVRNPNNWSALYNLGLSYFMGGDYPKAEDYLKRAVSVAPTESDAAALLAETQVREGKFTEAEPHIRRAIALKSYKPGYYRVLALSLEGQGRISDALAAAEKEARRDPSSADTRQLLSRLKANGAQPQSRTK